MNTSSWGFIPPTYYRMELLRQALTSSEFRDMLPPRLSGLDSTTFKDKVGGDVRPDRVITEEALIYLTAKGAIDVLHQNPPSVMRLHAGHMHLVYNHGTQIKFAAEVLHPDEVVIASVYHITLGSVFFAEANAEDYTSIYIKLEDKVKGIIAGNTRN